MTGEQRRMLRFTLNGVAVSTHVGVHETIVEVLQRDFGLFGARESCGQGLCGCCTVIVDGTAVSGCLFLAPFVEGTRVDTVEGLATEGTLHPIQQAFISKSAFQCGFCTPGFIMMTQELLKHDPHPSEDTIRHYLSGNLCRCACYPDIVDAVTSAAAAARQQSVP